MPTAIWGDSEAQGEKSYPSSMLKQILQQMLTQFAARGACIALYNEHTNQLVIQQHLRTRAVNSVAHTSFGTDSRYPISRTTGNLDADPAASAIGRLRRSSQPLSPLAELEEVHLQQSEFFGIGASYSKGHDLIGYCWQENRAYILTQEQYLEEFHPTRQQPFQTDLTPTWYLVAPIQAPVLLEENGKKPAQPNIQGVILLYQTSTTAMFQGKQRQDAVLFAERIALMLENYDLRRLQNRTSDYMQQLMQISTTFPTTVTLRDLVTDAHRFAARVVDVSSLLVTLYDRDSNKIYDVYAIQNGNLVERLPGPPVTPEERAQWCRVAQKEQKPVILAPASQDCTGYEELLGGVWGDQRQAASFLLLPMKIFNRVIGSLCLTSTYPNAYRPEEIKVLETMVQIITVGIENVRLYERARTSLQDAKRREIELETMNRKTREREEFLAAINSAMQAITSVLDVTELLQKFVQSVARLVQADMCIFFQTPTKHTQHNTQAAYETKENRKNVLGVFGLWGEIRLLFKEDQIQHIVTAGFHYLDAPMIEELIKGNDESGAIFLRETSTQKLLMIPVQYQTEIIGILTVHTKKPDRKFSPNEVGMLLALCAQAASAIRNAEDYAELQRMDKLKDEFLVTASHEFRTPLSAISGYASLLRRQSSRITPQQVLRFATKIAGATQQLSDQVTNMTEAARMGALDDKLALRIEPVPMRSAAEVAITMVSVNIEQQIVMNIPSELWANGDALRVRQVISNLLDNAAKYSPPNGRIEVKAEVTTLKKLSEEQINSDLIPPGQDEDLAVVLVSVSDEGEGIPKEDQQKIFEKFVRGTRTLTTPIRGSGLGLYICRRYIEAMGGKLWLAESNPTSGSTFSFYLQYIGTPPADEKDESAEKNG